MPSPASRIRRIVRRWPLALAALLLVLVSFASGLAVERGFPGLVPLPERSSPSIQFDQTKVRQASQIIGDNYYDSAITGPRLSQGSVEGMVAALDDPFSRYLTPEQFRSQEDAFAGRHDGAIGISIVFENGYPVVAGVLPNSPAVRVGLQSGDVLIGIAGTDAHGITPDRVAALLRGADGSAVQLVVRRETAEFALTVLRAQFQSPSVQTAHLPGHILYLRVYQFGDGTTQEFDSALQAGMTGAQGAVLDLRGNGGGRVSAAVAMVSRFQATGEVFEERGRDGRTEVVSVDGHHPAADLPLVVLVDHRSASSSEIVAGSLQAHGRAKLVGAETFGKGSVQVTYPLRDGSAISLTVEHWFLPDGRSINGDGLTPDIDVDLSEQTNMFDVAQPVRGYEVDTQLTEALAVLAAEPR